VLSKVSMPLAIGTDRDLLEIKGAGIGHLAKKLLLRAEWAALSQPGGKKKAGFKFPA